MKNNKLYLRWNNGVIEIRKEGEHIIISSKNYIFELRPRTIIIHGKIASYEHVETGKQKKRKYTYIYLDNAIEPKQGHGKIIKEVLYENFEVRYQDMGFEKFLTIVTPGAYLYEYVILTAEILTVAYSAKREAYVDIEPGLATIYFV
ncbi:MAG: hypothetical protein DRO40_06905 [Thermoprotei archaeon]|nr:MAG: hypothetical protein DRO40_06905 [Thermoprotei archaeon]